MPPCASGSSATPGCGIPRATTLVVAGLCGLLTARYRGRFLMWATALGGAGLAMTGLSRIAPSALDWLKHPDTALDGVASVGIWLVVALLGRRTQLRLFPRALRAQQDKS